MRSVGCEINGMSPIFKTEMFIYQSKANLDAKNLFRKITYHFDPEIRKMLVRGHLSEQGFHIPFSSII